MRRIVIAVLILILPTTTAVVVYLIVNKRVPTNRQAIGRVTTIAGAGYPGVEDGTSRLASLSDPFGVAIDRQGNLFVTDGGQSNRIKKITPDGKVLTIAGSTEGFADDNALQAQFNTPSGIAIDGSGNLIVADTSNNRIRRIASDGKVTTVAGTGRAGFKDGTSRDAEFDGPIGVAVDRVGNVFVADTYNDRVRKISTDGKVITIAGTGLPGFADGDASIGQLNTPSGIAIDESGNLFVADTGNSAVRRITPQGQVSTVTQNGADATGRFTELRQPVGIVTTHDGFLFVTEARRVVRIAPDGSAEEYAGGKMGFADGPGSQARFNGPAGIAVDREGNLFVADTHNYLIRQIESAEASSVEATPAEDSIFIQPTTEVSESNPSIPVPRLDAATLKVGSPFPWPLAPQDVAHEITGVIGEARGAPERVALDHLHSGLDIRGNQGDAVLSVLDEKVSSPVANWDFGGAGEGIQIGLISYVHTRIGRNARDEVQAPERFKQITLMDGGIGGVRVRRGTRFKVGDFIGTVNRLYHVHLNLGPWNAQANPLVLQFAGFKDTTPPTIEPNGIGVMSADGAPFTRKQNGRLLISGDVRITVSAYDRVDDSGAKRKLGLFRLGYQVLSEDGAPLKGFEQPLINLEFVRLPPDDSSVLRVYAEGSGVSAYGTPTEFKYIVTNRVRDGEARDGLLRTSNLGPGRYTIRVFAEDYAGNRAFGKSTEIDIAVIS